MVTLRLLVTNISSSSPTINTAAYYQRCVITCETVAVHRRPRLQHLSVAALTQAVKPDIGSESRFLPTPPAFDAPVRGVGFPSEYCYAVWHGKLEWRGYPTVKKIDDMFIRFDMIHDLIGVTRHSRSFKLVPFESLDAVSYLPSVVTMALACINFEVKRDIIISYHIISYHLDLLRRHSSNVQQRRTIQ